ncbi:MAG TPA: hypothetical protein VKV73_00630 [Chloroflexota bacterium]|nr:hypothetical protein [Chloroflexota bacterium]
MALKKLARVGLEIVGACWVAAAMFAGTLPEALVPGSGGFGAVVWVVLDGVAVAWLARSARPAFQVLTRQLTRLRTLSGELPAHAELGGPGAAGIARVLLVVAYVGVLQAILQRPLVMVLGTVADPSIAAAWLAVGVLVVLVLGLVRLHVVMHPVVVGSTRGMLDAIFATAQSTSLLQPTLAPAMAASDSTIGAPPTPGLSDATIVNGPADDTQPDTRPA